MPRFDDPLSMDVSRDLARVDDVITRILKDRRSWKDFIRDPNGTFVEFGLHPPVSSEENQRINRIFYACLTNDELLRYVLENYRDFEPEGRDEHETVVDAGLREGRIQNDLDYDLQALDHFLKNPEALRKMFQLAIYDLNDRGLLARTYEREEIDRFVESAAEAAVNRQPLRSQPQISDQTMAGVVGPVVVAVVGAEVGGVVTAVALPELVARRQIYPVLEGALVGDDDDVQRLGILGRLLDFSADLTTYLQNFERRR